MRESDMPAARPVEERRGQRSGLGDESQAPGACPNVGEARIQADARDEEADAVGAEDAQLMRPRSLQHRGGERSSAGSLLLEAGADDDGRARPPGAQGGDES